MRRTRKVLRFLRTIYYSRAIRNEIPQLAGHLGDPTTLALKVLTMLENLFTLLFYIFDHRVFLGELEVISKDSVATFYPRSIKMYLIQNIFGALKSLMEIAIIILEGKYEGEMIDMDNGSVLIRNKGIQFLRNILDIFVASYLIRQPKGGAAKTGIIGVVTSLIAIG